MAEHYSPYTINIIPPDFYEKAGVKRTAKLVGILLCLYVAFRYAISFAFAFFYSAVLEVSPMFFTTAVGEIVYQIINIISYIIMVFAPFLIYAFLVKIPPKAALPFSRPRLSLIIPAVPITLGASVLGIMAASILLTAFTSLGLNYNVSADPTPNSVVAKVLYIISLSVLPAIFEEIACRGILMQSLRRHGDSFALIVSSIVFSLLHGNFMQIPNAFVLGLVMGFFALRTNSLLTSMTMHFFNNFIITIIDVFVTPNMSEMEQTLTTLALFGVYAILGILALVFVLLKHKNILSLERGYGVMTTGSKLGAFYSHPLIIVGTVIFVLMCCTFFFV